MTSILSWIRDFNRNPENENKNKVSFYGIDIVAPNDALDQIFEYIQIVDASFFEEIQSNNYARDVINDNNWPTTWQSYADLTSEEKQVMDINYNELYDRIEQNESDYISKSTAKDYDWIQRLAYSAREANRMFSAEVRMEAGLMRDNAMAQNILWIKQSLSVEDKMIVWAHNVHIAKGEFSMIGETGSIKGMGYILHQELKDTMVSIGASFNQGEFQHQNRTFEPAEKSTLDGTLAELDMNYFILDLKEKSEDKNVNTWLNTEKMIRGQEFEMTCIPEESFDAIFYIDNISKVSYNQNTLQRFGN